LQVAARGRMGGNAMDLRGSRTRAGTALLVRIRNTHIANPDIVAWRPAESPDTLAVCALTAEIRNAYEPRNAKRLPRRAR